MIGPDIDKRPTVSVVLPTYNRAATLPRSIQSVLEQEADDLELIVVDDGSVDATEELVLSVPDQRVRYVRHDANRGVSAARNTGIRASQGRFVSFQDSDDIWLPGKLERQLSLMRSAPPSVGVVYTGVIREYPTHIEPIPHSAIPTRSGDVLGQLLVYNLATPPALLVRSQLLEDVGGFDEEMHTHEDWELMIRLATRTQMWFTGDYMVVSPYSKGGVNDVNATEFESAMHYVLYKHRNHFERVSGSVADIEGRIGAYMVRHGETKAGRGHLRKALALSPASPKRWALFVLSYLGPDAFCRLFERWQVAKFSSSRSRMNETT